MSELKYCLDCNTILTKDNDFTYCINTECSRFGLLTALCLKKPRQPLPTPADTKETE